MPHCIVEYSKELEGRVEPSALMTAAYQGALKTGLFEKNHIKARTIAYETYQTGDERLDFIHVTIRIFSGRTREQRLSLSNDVLAEFDRLNISSLSITVEICEIEKETYTKRVK